MWYPLSMERTAALVVRGLEKSYGRVRALAGVDLEMERGEILGFLGPNGAGKTTTIRCLLDLIRPDAGTMRVLGIDPTVDPVGVRERTGYLPGELRFYDDMTVEAMLRLLKGLRPGRAAEARVPEIATRLSLDLGARIRTLSRGNRQKVGLVQALMHEPDLLLLDEPTAGLDPLMQREVLRLLEEARGRGAAVFFSSHALGEVQAIADRVAIIRKGVVVEVAETASLVRRARRRVSVRFAEDVAAGALATIDGVRDVVRIDPRTFRLEVEGTMDPLVKALARWAVVDLETEAPSLEEAFLAYYEPGTVKA